jgi:RNA polymerase sigma-70 factor (ECF subfamily)
MDDARGDAILLVRAGSHSELFGVLFDRLFVSIHRYLARRVGVEGADELAAEVFRIAFEQRRRFRPLHESALPWLYGVATNLMLKRWRDERRRLRALASLEATADRDSRSLEGLEERRDAHSVRGQLLDGLASLAQGDRDVLVLREARPDAAGPAPELVRATRRELMSQIAVPARRRPKLPNRVALLAASAAVAAAAALVALTLSGRSGGTAWAAPLVRVAEAAPRLLVEAPGWSITPRGRVRGRLWRDDVLQRRAAAGPALAARRRLWGEARRPALRRRVTGGTITVQGSEAHLAAGLRRRPTPACACGRRSRPLSTRRAGRGRHYRRVARSLGGGTPRRRCPRSPPGGRSSRDLAPVARPPHHGGRRRLPACPLALRRRRRPHATVEAGKRLSVEETYHDALGCPAG